MTIRPDVAVVVAVVAVVTGDVIVAFNAIVYQVGDVVIAFLPNDEVIVVRFFVFVVFDSVVTFASASAFSKWKNS